MSTGGAADVLATGLRFPEGPAFARDGALWVSELQGGTLARLGRDRRLTRFAVGGAPNGLAFHTDGRLWFCDSRSNEVRSFDSATGGAVTMIAAIDGQPLDDPNDLAFDRAGNLVFTCAGPSRDDATGYLCCLDPSGACRVIGTNLHFPNGVAFAPDGKTLVVAETRRRRLWRGEWNAKARTLTRFEPWRDTGGPSGPDGLAVDATGHVYVAVYGTGRIEIFDLHSPATGAVRIDGANPTNCAFDPDQRWGLIVTEAEHGRLLSYPGHGPRPIQPDAAGTRWSA